MLAVRGQKSERKYSESDKPHAGEKILFQLVLNPSTVNQGISKTDKETETAAETRTEIETEN